MERCTRKPKVLGVPVVISVLIVGGILLSKRLGNEDPGSCKALLSFCLFCPPCKLCLLNSFKLSVCLFMLL